MTSRHPGAFQPLIESSVFKTNTEQRVTAENVANGEAFKNAHDMVKKSSFSKTTSNPASREPSPRAPSPFSPFSPVPRAFLPHLALNANRDSFIALPRPLGFGLYSSPQHSLLKKEFSAGGILSNEPAHSIDLKHINDYKSNITTKEQFQTYSFSTCLF